MGRNAYRIFGVFIGIVFVVIFILSFVYRDSINGLISFEARIYSAFAVFWIALILDFLPQYVSPHAIILNSGILGIRDFYFFIFILGGSVLGSVLGFFLGEKYGGGFVCRFFSEEQVRKIEKRVDAYGKWFMALAAVSPLPYIPMAFGAFGVKRKNFFIFGMTPRILGLVLLWFVFA